MQEQLQWASAAVWRRMFPVYLSTCYPTGGTLCEGLGGVPLLEEVRFQEPKSFPVISLYLLRVDKDVRLSYCTSAMGALTISNCEPQVKHLLLQVALVMVFCHDH